MEGSEMKKTKLNLMIVGLLMISSNAFAGRAAVPEGFNGPFHCFSTAIPKVIAEVKSKPGYSASKLSHYVNKLIVATTSAQCFAAFGNLVAYNKSL